MNALEMGLKASANAAKEVVKSFDNGILGVKRFNFKSQICTSRSQSERLLALGLKKETADMVWNIDWCCSEDAETILVLCEHHPNNYFPAWSLHRLIEMMPENIADDWLGVSFDEVTYYHGAGEEMIGWKFYKTGNVYNCCIDCIEWLIKEGYFNKEYLV